MTLYKRNLREHQSLFSTIDRLEQPTNEAADLVYESLMQGGKLMICGNGGSASDSQHIAAEFTGRFIKDRRPLAAIALSTDTSALTCISNDYSFKQVFSRQVQAIGKNDDVLLAISTSGNSENLIEAVHAAKSLGIKVIGLLGRDGGKLAPLCDLSIIVPSESTGRVQEVHIFIAHTICGMVEELLGVS